MTHTKTLHRERSAAIMPAAKPHSWKSPSRRICALGIIALAVAIGCSERRTTSGVRNGTVASTERKGSRLPASTTPTTSASSSSRPVGLRAMDGYVFAKPDQVDTLPHELDEASGITDVSATEVALVQDEKGVIFIYDLSKHSVSSTIPFGPPGDYEGLTRCGNTMFVLRSDGTIFEVQNWNTDPKVRARKLDLPTADNEGLGFDPVRQRILLAPKSKWKPGKEGKFVRPIFSFDPNEIRLDPNPHSVLDLSTLIEFAGEHDRSLPTKETKRGRERLALRFMPASLAVHPQTHEMFVMSAIDRVLASFDAQGRATAYQMLDASLFPQAEGISFLDDATAVIVSEAAGGRARLVQFRWSGGGR